MASIFSKIAAGEIPSYKCAESDKFYAFLDISPVSYTHLITSLIIHNYKCIYYKSIYNFCNFAPSLIKN